MEKKAKIILFVLLLIAVINTYFQFRWFGTKLQWVPLIVFGAIFVALQIMKKKKMLAF